MDMPDWVTGFPGAVTVSDADHRILWMNDKAAQVFAADGGRSLIGGDLDGLPQRPVQGDPRPHAGRRAAEHLHDREEGRQEVHLPDPLEGRVRTRRRARGALHGDPLRDAPLRAGAEARQSLPIPVRHQYPSEDSRRIRSSTLVLITDHRL
ncbi:MAG: hypothetical protein M0C28_48580 [Candidatus Moduliflexus flocculans]|nr:hypothetical protein [Candidatus Moduliflexus flocculans]